MVSCNCNTDSRSLQPLTFEWVIARIWANNICCPSKIRNVPLQKRCSYLLFHSTTRASTFAMTDCMGNYLLVHSSALFLKSRHIVLIPTCPELCKFAIAIDIRSRLSIEQERSFTRKQNFQSMMVIRWNGINGWVSFGVRINSFGWRQADVP